MQPMPPIGGSIRLCSLCLTDMFTSVNVKFHYQVSYDYVLLVSDNYVACVSNWGTNYPDEEQLVLAGPEPAEAPTLASAWDLSDEMPF